MHINYNTNVLQWANTKNMIATIKWRRIAYLGQVLRGEKYCFLQLILKGKIENWWKVGRIQQTRIENGLA